jgi:hypothetical protein
MNPLIGRCPVCGEELVVTQLECARCGTQIGGQFSLGRLSRLAPDEIGFVEIFVKNRGNAYRVGEELGMAYSSVRSRLTEIIGALGYEHGAEVKKDPEGTRQRRESILDDLANGKISPAEAVRMLEGS